MKKLTNFRNFSHNVEEVLVSKLTLILKDSSDQSVVKQGEQVHAQLIVNGVNHTGLLGTRILGAYVLCNKFLYAKKMFSQLDLLYASPWNWMIRGFTVKGCFDSALLFYFKMLSYGTNPDKYTFPYVIKACAGLNAVNLGKSIHKTIRVLGFETDVFVGSSLIKFYAENGCIKDARNVFDRMPERDSVLWNAMLSGYLKHGNTDNIVHLFMEMRNGETKPNSVTYACILSACASEENVTLGTQIHGLVSKLGLETNSRVTNTLLSLYAKCHFIFDARKLFDIMPRDLVAWNGMIGGCVQNGLMAEASSLFSKMICDGVKPDPVTFASFIPSIAESGRYNQGKEINGYIIRHGVHLDLFLKNALIDMYFKCRNAEAARNIFKYSNAVDIVIYTAMISGYVLNEMNSDALESFRFLLREKMKPNAVTLTSILPACADLAALKLGKELHAYALKNGLEGRCYVSSACTDMYAKCGRLDLARQMFVKMPERDSVSWNSMITSCAQNGNPQEAVNLFREMGIENIKYDGVSISAALSACANLPSLSYGKEIHSVITKNSELSSDIFAKSALIDTYAKCGALDSAHKVFDKMPIKNEVSWNSIISAYGNHGRLEECLSFFHEMKQLGFNPDHVTFLTILSACGHGGHVEQGKLIFTSMTKEFNIEPKMEHYACMVDLLGRSGQLNEAYEVIKSMPFEPDAGVWGTLLGSCRVHGDVDLAELASGHLFQMDPQNSGYYVLLSNVQANSGKWDGVLKTRKMMKERGVSKIPGYSWIELHSKTHVFAACDTGHVSSDQIYVMLNRLLHELRKEGYVPKPYLPVYVKDDVINS